MNRETFEHLIFEMMGHAAKAKQIGSEITERLLTPGTDGEQLFSLLDRILNCEVTEFGTALEVYGDLTMGKIDEGREGA